MMRTKAISVVLLAVITCCVAQTTQQWTQTKAAGYSLVASSGQSKLYTVQILSGYQYQYPIYVVDLHGSHYQMGYDYGFLLGTQAKDNYLTFFQSLLGNTFLDSFKLGIIEDFLDWQWKFLSEQIPANFLEEFSGLRDGGKAAGLPSLFSLDVLSARMVTIANAPGSFGDLIYILLDELNHTISHDNALSEFKKEALFNSALARLGKKAAKSGVKGGFGCSMFAVWGPRTASGDLFTARNLDWASDLGINQHKLVTIYHPTGSHSYATIGYVGIVGALAGISDQKMTVHEATLEENEMSFFGFSWSLRLRYVMENAHDLQSALQIWDSTNNTVSFNHMISSASDLPAVPAVVIETMKDYNAFFFDNDPREANAVVKGQHIGAPLPNAVWRTNHPYDPITSQHYLWNDALNSWTVERYMFIHEAFLSYQTNNVPIGPVQALNVTAIAADKGTDPYHCHGKKGSNIMSIMFQPGQAKIWAAWEDGSGAQWVPAPCAAYVEMDLSVFFSNSAKNSQ